MAETILGIRKRYHLSPNIRRNLILLCHILAASLLWLALSSTGAKASVISLSEVGSARVAVSNQGPCPPDCSSVFTAAALVSLTWDPSTFGPPGTILPFDDVQYVFYQFSSFQLTITLLQPPPVPGTATSLSVGDDGDHFLAVGLGGGDLRFILSCSCGAPDDEVDLTGFDTDNFFDPDPADLTNLALSLADNDEELNGRCFTGCTGMDVTFPVPEPPAFPLMVVGLVLVLLGVRRSRLSGAAGVLRRSRSRARS